MKILHLTIIAFVCSLLATNVGAVAIGAPEKTARIGYGMGVGIININDPQGNVETDASMQLFQLAYSDLWFQGYRYWGDVFFDSSEHKATETKIGQEIRRFGVRAIVHRQMYISDKYTLWAGGGLQLAQEQYKLRHQVDSDGFLVQSFGDRTQTSLALVLDMINEWQINTHWDIGGRLRYSFALGDGVDDLAASVVFLYRLRE